MAADAIKPLKPGSTIGILGGGQLGRMMAMSAAQLGYRCIAFAPERDGGAGDVCADYFENRWDDAPALAAFGKAADIITWEFENVPAAVLDALPADRLACPPAALETAQDRVAEKRFVEGLGGRAAPFAAVENRDELENALERIGTPGILKTARDGYDGKGQWRVSSAHEAQGLALSGGPFVYEGLVRFDAEFSVILVRGRDGEIRFWDSARNTHEDGILRKSSLPAGDAIAGQVEQARTMARDVADALRYVGVITLEFFATAQGPVFNEIAPRVHNSGHWTIEGAATSQFENHVRAICGLPLGDTATIARSVEMENLIGKDANTANALLAERDAHLHLYGKGRARAGRKMGHVTRIGR